MEPFGIVSVYLLGFMHHDPEINLALTLSVSYICYFTAQEVADSSGILTVVTLGMVFTAVGRTTFKGNCQQSLHNFWEGTAYIANTLIFILSGVIMAKGFFLLRQYCQSWELLGLSLSSLCLYSSSESAGCGYSVSSSTVFWIWFELERSCHGLLVWSERSSCIINGLIN